MTHARRRLFTSESVTEGHPDKIADQISDAVLDAVLEKDPLGRVACETALTTGTALVFGEISTDAYVDIAGIVRRTIKDIGYVRAKYGFDYETCGVLVCIDEQSPDIAQGVNTGGAGDQGMMFGFACDETPELMPAPDPAGPRRWPGGSARSAGTAPCAGPGLTARPRSPSSTTPRAGRAAWTTCWSASSTPRTPRTSRSSSDVQRHVVDEVIPAGVAGQRHHPPRQPHRPLRHRRSAGRRRADRPQDHRRQLRRLRAPRRRRVQRQGPDQGRPQRRVRRPLGGQEHRRRRHGEPSARSRWPTPSGWSSRCRCSSRPSAPRASRSSRSRSSSTSTSTSRRSGSSRRSSCAGRSTGRWPPSAISGARPRPALGAHRPRPGPGRGGRHHADPRRRGRLTPRPRVLRHHRAPWHCTSSSSPAAAARGCGR